MTRSRDHLDTYVPGQSRGELHSRLDRRRFLSQLGAAASAATLAGGPSVAEAITPEMAGAGALSVRRSTAYRVRVLEAQRARSRPRLAHVGNGDEARYPNHIGSFSKGLPHDARGEVDSAAYASFKAALHSGDPNDFEAIVLGVGRKLVNPQAAWAFDLEGADSHAVTMPPAPPVAGAEAAAELAELYWMALARDVSFTDWPVSPLIGAAAADLTPMTGFRGPRRGGAVTADTLFRGSTPGDLVGPYVSQFLWLDIPMGALTVPQAFPSLTSQDYLTTYPEWLAVQNGFVPPEEPLTAPRYIATLRDLARWVQVDALYQAYHQACLILLGMNAPVGPGNPYASSLTQIGFGTFGGPHILSLVTEVATRALKAVWCQKWLVHHRLRPEAMGGSFTTCARRTRMACRIRSTVTSASRTAQRACSLNMAPISCRRPSRPDRRRIRPTARATRPWLAPA